MVQKIQNSPKFHVLWKITIHGLRPSVESFYRAGEKSRPAKIRMHDQGRCEDFALGGGEVRFTAWIVSIHLILRRPRGAIMVGAEQKNLKNWIL
jgi:hypothetical protein